MGQSCSSEGLFSIAKGCAAHRPCPDFERTNRKVGIEDFVDPTPDARGEIAWLLIYMGQVYDLPLDGAINEKSLLLAWHEQDPPDDQEQAREREIRRLQGTWNPLVLP